MKKRLISLLLAFSMMLTFLPAGAVSAFAEEKIDSSTETLIPNNNGGVYTITKANTTYQMKGDYNFPIKITAKGVTINIIGNITYGFEVHHGGDIPYLIDVETTGGVTINNYANYNVTTSKSDCGFVTTRELEQLKTRMHLLEVPLSMVGAILQLTQKRFVTVRVR